MLASKCQEALCHATHSRLVGQAKPSWSHHLCQSEASLLWQPLQPPSSTRILLSLPPQLTLHQMQLRPHKPQRRTQLYLTIEYWIISAPWISSEATSRLAASTRTKLTQSWLYNVTFRSFQSCASRSKGLKNRYSSSQSLSRNNSTNALTSAASCMNRSKAYRSRLTR